MQLCVALCSSVEKEKLLKEVKTMSRLIHPNVMSLIGLCFDGQKSLLIMPFMSKGNVLEYVKQNEVDLHKDQEASEMEVYNGGLNVSVFIIFNWRAEYAHLVS